VRGSSPAGLIQTEVRKKLQNKQRKENSFPPEQSVPAHRPDVPSLGLTNEGQGIGGRDSRLQQRVHHRLSGTTHQRSLSQTPTPRSPGIPTPPTPETQGTLGNIIQCTGPEGTLIRGKTPVSSLAAPKDCRPMHCHPRGNPKAHPCRRPSPPAEEKAYLPGSTQKIRTQGPPKGSTTRVIPHPGGCRTKMPVGSLGRIGRICPGSKGRTPISPA